MEPLPALLTRLYIFRSWGIMRSVILIVLLLCFITVILAAPRKERSLEPEYFKPNEVKDCGSYGTLVGENCVCEKHFHGDYCEYYHSRRCTTDEQCGSEHAYCMRKLFLQCRLSAHCKDPWGWCVPLDAAY